MKMGLSGSSMTPVTAANDSPPSECPMHKKQQNFSQSAAGGECPASFGTGQPVISDADIDPTNMVSSNEFFKLQGVIQLQFCVCCNRYCCCCAVPC